MTWRTFPPLARHHGPVGASSPELCLGLRARGWGGRLAAGPELGPLGESQLGSFQSGIGVISGWACAADLVEIVFENGTTGEQTTVDAGYGTVRTDTEPVCGDTDNGFGLLWNWNKLGEGRHTVRAVVDGVEIAWSTFTVTTLGEEFVRGLEGEYALADFPTVRQTVTVEWQEALQNFVITTVE